MDRQFILHKFYLKEREREKEKKKNQREKSLINIWGQKELIRFATVSFSIYRHFQEKKQPHTPHFI